MDLYKPMEPILTEKIINNKDWIHQIKFDGIRGLTYIHDDKVRTFVKSGRERTSNYIELFVLPQLIQAKEAILDGEMVVMENKRPSFDLIALRERVSKVEKIKEYSEKYPLEYKVFDILSVDNEDLRNKTYVERKSILNNILCTNEYINIVKDYSDGEELCLKMEKNNFEGIVSKKLNSLYLPGKKHRYWYKKKIYKKALVIVGGLTYKEGFPRSLLVGAYKNNDFIYLGNVYSGLKQSDFKILKLNMDKISQDKCPFKNIKDSSEVIWLKPLITCYVNFLEITKDGSLRHPKIIGFTNKNPKEAKIEGEYFADYRI